MRYATTLGANALIERNSPAVGALVTAGLDPGRYADVHIRLNVKRDTAAVTGDDQSGRLILEFGPQTTCAKFGSGSPKRLGAPRWLHGVPSDPCTSCLCHMFVLLIAHDIGRSA